MTNADIIAQYRQANGLPDDLELYTCAVWRNKGFTLKKGEHCKHKIPLKTYKQGKCKTKTMYLFERGQVEEKNKKISIDK